MESRVRGVARWLMAGDGAVGFEEVTSAMKQLAAKYPRKQSEVDDVEAWGVFGATLGSTAAEGMPVRWVVVCVLIISLLIRTTQQNVE